MKIKNIFKSLSIFEICLWSISSLVIIVSSIVTKGDIFATITSLIGAASLIFIAKGYPLGQILGIAFMIMYSYISYKSKYYGELICSLLLSLPMAVYTLIVWLKHPFDKKTSQVQVGKSEKKSILVIVFLAISFSIICYFILKIFNTPNIFVSTLSITTSFIAVSFMAIRSPYYAIGYALNDIVLIVLWSMETITNIMCLPVLINFIVFLANDTYGFFNWIKIRKNQSNL